ncbi:MAG: tetratricopeptide repeat protein [Fibrobacterota bacterium]
MTWKIFNTAAGISLLIFIAGCGSGRRSLTPDFSEKSRLSEPGALIIEKIHTEPVSSPELAETADSLINSGNYREALRIYKNLPDDIRSIPGIIYNKAICLEETGDTVNAVKNYKKAYKLDSSFENAAFNAGRLLFLKNKYQEAYQAFWNAAHKKNPAVLRTLLKSAYYSAAELYDKGNFKASEKYIDTLLSLDRESVFLSGALYLKALILHKHYGEKTAALSLLRRVINIEEKNLNDTYYKAEAYYMQAYILSEPFFENGKKVDEAGLKELESAVKVLKKCAALKTERIPGALALMVKIRIIQTGFNNTSVKKPAITVSDSPADYAEKRGNLMHRQRLLISAFFDAELLARVSDSSYQSLKNPGQTFRKRLIKNSMLLLHIDTVFAAKTEKPQSTLEKLIFDDKLDQLIFSVSLRLAETFSESRLPAPDEVLIHLEERKIIQIRRLIKRLDSAAVLPEEEALHAVDIFIEEFEKLKKYSLLLNSIYDKSEADKNREYVIKTTGLLKEVKEKALKIYEKYSEDFRHEDIPSAPGQT